MEEAHIVVDLEVSLQRELDTLLANHNEAKNITIFRIPHNISKSMKNLFEPSVISIGPFHHAQTSLRALEEQKLPFLQDFLSRGDHITLDLCISEMKLLEKRTRGCYSEIFNYLDSDAFVKMMLLDGCFVLEFFLQNLKPNPNSIGEVGWNFYFILRDFLLQENQIPFFIVEKLHELIVFKQEDRMHFVKHIGFIFCTLGQVCQYFIDPPAEIHHLVHLCYHYLVPNPDKPVVLSSKSFVLTTMFRANRIIKGLLHRFRMVLRRRSPHLTTRSLSVAMPNYTESIVIPSATELKEAGLKFTQQSNAKHMLDISFEYGVLKIPRLAITDDTKPIFANLVAFEYSKYGKEGSPFTTFVKILDNLVNTQKDVTILQECGIIDNRLGSEEELTNFINQVTEGNFLERDHYLAELYREVNRYMGTPWRRQRAKFARDYLSGRSAGISLTALALLLVTCIQSFFPIYAYFHPPKP